MYSTTQITVVKKLSHFGVGRKYWVSPSASWSVIAFSHKILSLNDDGKIGSIFLLPIPVQEITRIKCIGYYKFWPTIAVHYILLSDLFNIFTQFFSYFTTPWHHIKQIITEMQTVLRAIIFQERKSSVYLLVNYGCQFLVKFFVLQKFWTGRRRLIWITVFRYFVIVRRLI